jgi:hypothetical protein
MRYRAGATYPWEYMGGTPMKETTEALGQTSTVYPAFDGIGPGGAGAWVLPHSGVWAIRWAGYVAVANPGLTALYLSPVVGAAALDGPATMQGQQGSGASVTGSRFATAAKGAAVVLAMAGTAGLNNAYFRQLELHPVRVVRD